MMAMPEGAEENDNSEKEYTLYYLPLYVRGEATNMLLTHAGVSYEEITIPMEEWKDYRNSMPNK